MKSTSSQIDQLMDEHGTLMRHYGKAQTRCSELMSTQAAELVALRAQAVRLRAALIIRETALAWEREDRAASNTPVPGLQSRLALARRAEQLVELVHDLLRERMHWQWRRPTDHTSTPVISGVGVSDPVSTIAMPISGSEPLESNIDVETSLAAADLVICQTGCLSHDAYWRVHDHCRRTGKPCVVVAQPDAVRVVRIHQMPTCKNSARVSVVDTAIVVSASVTSTIPSDANF